MTVVETLACDALLGMDFIAAGVLDTWTDKFTYKWSDSTGILRSWEISAMCPTTTTT